MVAVQVLAQTTDTQAPFLPGAVLEMVFLSHESFYFSIGWNFDLTCNSSLL